MPSSLSAARNQIASLRDALLSASPARIAECAPGLAEAAARLEALERDLRERRAVDITLHAELQLLRRELSAVTRTIAQGAEFYRGWAKLLGTAMSGYTPSGEAGPVAAAGSISLQG
ncbi:MAG: hypothetical protein ACRD30_07045 [Bryobacteraceae bacterium]